MKGFKRPKMSVLPDSAVVPDENMLPPPKKFTHLVVAEQPYFYSDAPKPATPAGTFAAGTRVLLSSHDDGAMCRVVDERGLHVFTACDGLQRID
jgi:hypothetical protein